LAQTIDPALREAIVARIRFYRELGLTEFYRRPVDPSLAILAQTSSTELGAPEPALSLSKGLASETWDTTNPDNRRGHSTEPPHPILSAPSAERVGDQFANHPEFHSNVEETATIPSRKPIPAPATAFEIIPSADRAAALQAIRDDIGDCTRCALHKGRNKIVFADGSPTARLMFVGEGPGADEDAQGLPFVGRAGQLLNNMINAMGLKREEVYIANVVKCRPPGNRTPEPEEANTCTPFLFRQIDVVRPEVLVALGATAATYLLGARQPLAGLRGRVHTFRGAKLIVTYHPAYLLRDPRQKKEAWADLQIAMRELGLKAPLKG
jgi:uracil-DNA glycosylase